MAEGKSVRCAVCGYPNPPGAEACKECGTKLVPSVEAGMEEDEIDKLLEVLGEVETPTAAPKGKAGLDIEKEIVDELLDSLLVEEEKEAKEVFECPMCGATLNADAVVCSSCGVEFEAPVPELEVPPPPTAEVPEEIAEEKYEPSVKVEVSEVDLPKMRSLSGRLIDVVVIITVIALVAVFFAFGMYSATDITVVSLGVFGGIAVGGMIVGLALFRISTSAMAQGDRLVKEGRYSDAIEYYNRAIRMGSKPSVAWSSKGVAFKRMKEYDEALRCEDIGIKIDPKNEFAWCNKGDIYFKKGEFPEAVACYDKALEIRPRYAIAWNNKGAALARLGEFKEAKSCHEKAIKLRPKYIAAWLNRGEVLVRLGQREEAEKSLRRAKSLGA
ncbi:MAG: tetratricopeptide repeat protein [Methanobacteriota archaeon]|nr:MAG: tetratricopeptide repeat protein [Euryarchaeota archaeon]